MQALIDVFRMSEISTDARVKIIVALGRAVNDQMGSNITETLVHELVRALDPNHKEASDPWRRFCSNEISLDEYKNLKDAR